jgi:hypothetical protein
MKSNTKVSEQGGMLVAAMMMVVVLGCLAAAVMYIGSYVGVEASRDINKVNAFWTAEAGLEHVKTMIGTTRDRLADSLVLPNVITGSTGRGSYTVCISNEWENTWRVYKKYIVTSTGVVPGTMDVTNIVSMRAYLPTFARYGHTSHDEAGVSFTSGDIIDGPVRVDNRLNINGTPKFTRLVQAPLVSPAYTTNNAAIFAGGIDVNPGYTNNFVDGTSYFAMIKTNAATSGFTNSGNYIITFLTNMFTYQTNGGVVRTNTTLLTQTNGGSIYINGNITVRGVVSGRVSVAAQRTLYITNDIVYFGGTNTVNDFLGLVASNSVTITPTNTVNIHASILVTSGGFNAAASNKEYYAVGKRPYINLFGSLGQYKRGIVGDIGTKGFLKNSKFDARFEYDGPPSSASDHYEYSGWSRVGGN